MVEASAEEWLRVLRCKIFETDLHVGFGGLPELIHQVLDAAATLPTRQRQALLTAGGMAGDPAPRRTAAD
ncbi:hypothetical protein [Rhodococcus jostii]|uniref:Uncharacterized protein n=1 Tax=Rhodococcus jostii TaxID=132919 RepID=A0ABU4CP48_RHOJO|nr:hypothetical protein [Rhodococcus jostii]MDV6285023.1 hypothetical protein [Rhodococcus jostii]